jgi:small nuclear ribonucleoprotein (snRNP)-like protein
MKQKATLSLARQLPAKVNSENKTKQKYDYKFNIILVFRGKLVEAEDNMNCQMTHITVTYRDGRTANLENVYIRGSKIRFLILPDMLKNAPMFKKQGAKTGTAGRGKSAILRAQGLLPLVSRNPSNLPYF